MDIDNTNKIMIWIGFIVLIALCIIMAICNASCYGNQINAVSVMPKMDYEQNVDNSIPQEGGKTMGMYASLAIMLGIMTGLIMLLTELVGSSFPLLKFVPKKLLSIVIAILVIVGYKLLSHYCWIDLCITGVGSWFLAGCIWENFAHGKFFSGWFKKI